MYQEKGLYRPYAKIMKETVNVPIICAGRMDNPDMASKAIRPCISCQEGCMGRIQHYSMLNCAVNPQACKEKDNALTPILKKKKVLIVGGGVAGCEVARVLALRGHEPVLYEKTNKLGDNLIPGGTPDFKEDDIALANWYSYTLKELNVEVNLNSEMLENLIPFNNIDVKVDLKVKKYKDGILEIETETGIEKIKCDSVILSVEYKEENSLYKELEFEIPELYLLGDARKVSNIMYVYGMLMK